MCVCVFVQIVTSPSACAHMCTTTVCRRSLCLQVCLSVGLHLLVSVSVCVCVCVCARAQLSQVCVINQLSGQFICWVTSCNFPPDSRPPCQVGITLRAHDKTLHLSVAPHFFPLRLVSAMSLLPPPDVPFSTPCFLASASRWSLLLPSFFLSFFLSLYLSLSSSSIFIFPPMNNIILSPWSKKKKKKGGLYN